MNEEILNAFQECLVALEQGEMLEQVLARYPDLEDELRPALETVRMAKIPAEIEVTPELLHRSRTRLLGHAARLKRTRPRSLFGLSRFAGALLAGAFVVLISVGGLVTASAQALPGDTLYGMKRVVENVRLSITSDGNSKQNLQASYDQRRIDETLRLLELGRSQEVTFEGVVKEKSAETWLVDEIQVHLTSDTIILGTIGLGMSVEVEGIVLPGYVVEAIQIELHEDDDGAESSDFEDTEDSSDTPTEEDEGELEGTEEPDETRAPEDTDDPEESETPEPHESDEPEETYEPEKTDEPGETDESDETDKPDETDEPDDTEEPDKTPKPEETPEPTETPKN